MARGPIFPDNSGSEYAGRQVSSQQLQEMSTMVTFIPLARELRHRATK